MESLLNNPVYHALLTGDAHRGSGTEQVKFFDEEISPFAGIDEHYAKGFEELRSLVPGERVILYATRREISEPEGWQLLQHMPGLQFVYGLQKAPGHGPVKLVPLEKQHVDEMVALAALTKPGPFDKRTIEFGHYFGVFHHNHLVAMAGQRLHVASYTEVSAVCTHPDHLGKGYAGALLAHQIALIIGQGQTPFLHVRADNARAIALYERIGFAVRGNMNFYVLKRRG